MPHLKSLDDAPLTSEEEGGGEREESSLSSRSTLFAMSEAGVESDWRIVQQSIKQSTVSMTQLDDDASATIGATNTMTTGKGRKQWLGQNVTLREASCMKLYCWLAMSCHIEWMG